MKIDGRRTVDGVEWIRVVQDPGKPAHVGDYTDAVWIPAALRPALSRGVSAWRSPIRVWNMPSYKQTGGGGFSAPTFAVDGRQFVVDIDERRAQFFGMTVPLVVRGQRLVLGDVEAKRGAGLSLVDALRLGNVIAAGVAASA